jgi:hypothetical protein
MSWGRDSVCRLMRVGVYVDAFNLHYVVCSLRGWGAWLARLDLRALASTLFGEQAASWKQARRELRPRCRA